MTYFIPSHDLGCGHENLLPRIPDKRARVGKTAEERPGSIDLRLNSLWSDACTTLAVDRRAANLETWEAWTAAMQMYNSLFDITIPEAGTPVEFMFDHKTRRTTATGPRYSTDVGAWDMAFYLAITCRDQERWKRLCHIDVELLRQAEQNGGAQYNAFTYHWAAARQAYILHRPELVEELTAAMELSDPTRSEFGDPDHLNKVVFPQMNTFLKFAQGDSDAFNESLANGLTLWRDYVTSDEERAEDVKNVTPLGLLALACMGYDRSHHETGFQLEVESDYLPIHIVERTWYGEFDI
ncbi:immunity protein 49 of polymorphic toxin system [Nocardiopsis sp. Huas11]|uniref:immunity 49 family protein n=1 Tax=Nocardiopsis sp. Huas11 TaxID=2183912 RepID=UPI000EB3AD26|nr:immunity 49 family protein [Nocardiopsis sp. Huas11]RKS05675.1 immunity protein 49 of polymorphic toxin system [Nocardiopsis sp. Huas11]